MNKENNESKQINYSDDEISLKDLTRVLLNEKKLIAIITIIGLFIAILYSFVGLKAEYQNNVLVSVDIDTKIIATPYGELDNPYNNLEEYMSMAKKPEVLEMTEKDMQGLLDYNEITNAIGTKVEVADQYFSIKATSDNPEQAYQLIKIHSDNFMQYVQYNLSKEAIHKLYNNNASEIHTIEKELEIIKGNIEKGKERLENIPKTIGLENALISQADYSKFVSNGEFDIDAFNGQRMINQAVNPSYIAIENKIVELKMEADKLLSSIEVTEKNLEILGRDKQKMEECEEVPSIEELNEGVWGALKNLVFIAQSPQTESKKITQNPVLKVGIILILGFVLGVFLALVKNYWKKIKKY